MSVDTQKSSNDGRASSFEPSMEDVLASIRQIINDGDGPAEPGPSDEPETGNSRTLTDGTEGLFVVEDAPGGGASFLTMPGDGPDTDFPDIEAGIVTVAEASPPGENADIDLVKSPMAAITDDVRDVTNDWIKSPDDTPANNERTPRPGVRQGRILDGATESAVAETFASLNRMIEEKTVINERGDRINDLVMEALRPMLKDWLDEHLKDIVEGVVQEEVRRIASGKQ